MQETEDRQTTALLTAIDAMEATLSVAAALIAEGRRIDLDGLDAEIGRVCAACLAASRAAAPAVRGRLSGLVAQIDRLQGALTAP